MNGIYTKETAIGMPSGHRRRRNLRHKLLEFDNLLDHIGFDPIFIDKT